MAVAALHECGCGR